MNAMNEMTVEHITELQKGYRVSGTQEVINTGLCWLMEGSVGRFASDCLEAGICMLPEERHRDYYGSTVPSRNDVKPDSKGGLVNAQNFWQKVEDGDFEVIDALEQMFGADVEEEVQ